MSQEEGISVTNRITAWLSRKTAMSAIRRVADLPIAMATDVGVVRKENEDRVAVARGCYTGGGSYVLAAVCDGMGGMADGAVCASLGLGAFFAEFFALANNKSARESVLVTSAMKANSEVYSRYRGAGGTTLSAVLIDADKSVYWLNVGDSRIYQYAERGLIQLTKDDTIAGQLEDRDPAFEGSADLLQYVGIGPDLEPHTARFLDLPETKLLLTSDGVHYLHADLMAKLASHAPDSANFIRRLIDLSKWCGGHDNATALILSPTEFHGSMLSSADPALYEVWDAFGELQLVVPPHIFATQSDKKKADDALSIKSVPSQVEVRGAVDSSPEYGRPVETKKVTRKKKSRKAGANQEGAEGGAEKVIPPQLKIKFPNKS
jgi:serine/threonine protein phosphatase PrpC